MSTQVWKTPFLSKRKSKKSMNCNSNDYTDTLRYRQIDRISNKKYRDIERIYKNRRHNLKRDECRVKINWGSFVHPGSTIRGWPLGEEKSLKWRNPWDRISSWYQIQKKIHAKCQDLLFLFLMIMCKLDIYIKTIVIW